MARARSPLTMEGCRDFVSLSSLHVNMSISNHSTTRKSWRSDAPIILPGWECHTGGSRSKPTVHRCRPKTGGCGLLTRTQDEPTKNNILGQARWQHLRPICPTLREPMILRQPRWRHLRPFCPTLREPMISRTPSMAAPPCRFVRPDESR